MFLVILHVSHYENILHCKSNYLILLFLKIYPQIDYKSPRHKVINHPFYIKINHNPEYKNFQFNFLPS